jgi:hypothetical protein
MTDQPDRPEMTKDQREALQQMEVSYKRPGVLTLIGVILFIEALVSAVNAITIFVQRDDAGFQAVTARTSGELATTAFIEAAFAIAFFLVGWGIMSGYGWARLVTAIVVGVRLAAVTWLLLTHLGGAVNTIGLIQAGIGIFVLWSLYGNDKSERFFGDKGFSY